MMNMIYNVVLNIDDFTKLIVLYKDKEKIIIRCKDNKETKKRSSMIFFICLLSLLLYYCKYIDL